MDHESTPPPVEATGFRIDDLIIDIAAACGTVAPALTAHADTTVQSVRVSYADLNLANEAGIAALYGRLRNAAGTVCGSVSISNLREFADWSQFRKGALTSAIEKVNHPALTDLHRQKTGYISPTLVASSGAKPQ
jgi:UrcA family protein